MMILVSSFLLLRFFKNVFPFVSMLFAPFVPIFAFLCITVFWSPPFWVYVCTTASSWRVLVATACDGIPHVTIVPLPWRTGTAVHLSILLLSSIKTFIIEHHHHHRQAEVKHFSLQRLLRRFSSQLHCVLQLRGVPVIHRCHQRVSRTCSSHLLGV